MIFHQKRVVATATAALFLLSTFSSNPSYAAQPSLPEVVPGSLNQITSLHVPAELGELQEVFPGKGKTVILIQDAHSIPDAQRSIQKLVAHFQKSYGVRLVATEGAASKADPQIFRSFPDRGILKKTFDSYFEKGELAGGNAAAIFNETPGDYHGVENWQLYGQALGLYLDAMEKSGPALDKILTLETKLQDEKENAYSKALLEIDKTLESFRENRTDLISVIKALAQIERPTAGSEMDLVLRESENGDSSRPEIEIGVKALAVEIQKQLNGLTPQDWQKTFSEKNQEFQTSGITAQAFALYLKELIAEQKLNVPFPDSLLKSAREQRKIRDLEGTQFFKAFEAYSDSVKAKLFRNGKERNLDRQTSQLRLLKNLARLEISREDWAAFQEIRKTGALEFSAESLKPFTAFYANAQSRDQAFCDNLMKLMENEPTAMLIAGGFHSQGVAERLRAQGIAYALVMPRINTIPGENHYQDHMRGDVSWKSYFEVERGRVNLYKAFVRATRDKLLAPSSGADDKKFLLKNWRDQIIRDLSQKGEIEKSGEYTVFLDETVQKKQSSKLHDSLARADTFLAGLRDLESKNQLTEQNILNLLKPSSTAVPVAEVGGLFPSDAPAQSELGLGLSRQMPAPSSELVTSPKSEVRSDRDEAETGQPLEQQSISAQKEIPLQGLKWWQVILNQVIDFFDFLFWSVSGYFSKRKKSMAVVLESLPAHWKKAPALSEFYAYKEMPHSDLVTGGDFHRVFRAYLRSDKDKKEPYYIKVQENENWYVEKPEPGAQLMLPRKAIELLLGREIELYSLIDQDLELRDFAPEFIGAGIVSPDNLPLDKKERRLFLNGELYSVTRQVPGINVFHDRLLGIRRTDFGFESLPLPSLERAIDELQKIADTLEQFHKKKIYHRDLKSQEIYIGEDGKARILDFDAAVMESPEAPELSLLRMKENYRIASRGNKYTGGADTLRERDVRSFIMIAASYARKLDDEKARHAISEILSPMVEEIERAPWDKSLEKYENYPLQEIVRIFENELGPRSEVRAEKVELPEEAKLFAKEARSAGAGVFSIRTYVEWLQRKIQVGAFKEYSISPFSKQLMLYQKTVDTFFDRETGARDAQGLLLPRDGFYGKTSHEMRRAVQTLAGAIQEFERPNYQPAVTGFDLSALAQAKGYQEKLRQEINSRSDLKKEHPGYRAKKHASGKDASPKVLSNDREGEARIVNGIDKNERYADPADYYKRSGVTFSSYAGSVARDLEGRPLNPVERTGLEGRHDLGKWGRNLAGDPIISKIENGKRKILLVQREDGNWAIPGGMVDDDDSPAKLLSRIEERLKDRMAPEILRELLSKIEAALEKQGNDKTLIAAIRELMEETGNIASPSAILAAKPIYRGYVDDSRNTDNAWMETGVWTISIESAADIAAVVPYNVEEVRAVQWKTIEEIQAIGLGNLHASHGKFLAQAFPELTARSEVRADETKKSANDLKEKIKSKLESKIFSGQSWNVQFRDSGELWIYTSISPKEKGVSIGAKSLEFLKQAAVLDLFKEAGYEFIPGSQPGVPRVFKSKTKEAKEILLIKFKKTEEPAPTAKSSWKDMAFYPLLVGAALGGLLAYGFWIEAVASSALALAAEFYYEYQGRHPEPTDTEQINVRKRPKWFSRDGIFTRLQILGLVFLISLPVVAFFSFGIQRDIALQNQKREREEEIKQGPIVEKTIGDEESERIPKYPVQIKELSAIEKLTALDTEKIAANGVFFFDAQKKDMAKRFPFLNGYNSLEAMDLIEQKTGVRIGSLEDKESQNLYWAKHSKILSTAKSFKENTLNKSDNEKVRFFLKSLEAISGEFRQKPFTREEFGAFLRENFTDETLKNAPQLFETYDFFQDVVALAFAPDEEVIANKSAKFNEFLLAHNFYAPPEIMHAHIKGNAREWLFLVSQRFDFQEKEMLIIRRANNRGARLNVLGTSFYKLNRGVVYEDEVNDSARKILDAVEGRKPLQSKVSEDETVNQKFNHQLTLMLLKAVEANPELRNENYLRAVLAHTTALHEFAHLLGYRGEKAPYLTELAYGKSPFIPALVPSYWMMDNENRWIYGGIFSPVTKERSGRPLLAIRAYRKLEPEKIQEEMKGLLREAAPTIFDAFERDAGKAFREELFNKLLSSSRSETRTSDEIREGLPTPEPEPINIKVERGRIMSWIQRHPGISIVLALISGSVIAYLASLIFWFLQQGNNIPAPVNVPPVPAVVPDDAKKDPFDGWLVQEMGPEPVQMPKLETKGLHAFKNPMKLDYSVRDKNRVVAKMKLQKEYANGFDIEPLPDVASHQVILKRVDGAPFPLPALFNLGVKGTGGSFEVTFRDVNGLEYEYPYGLKKEQEGWWLLPLEIRKGMVEVFNNETNETKIFDNTQISEIIFTFSNGSWGIRVQDLKRSETRTLDDEDRVDGVVSGILSKIEAGSEEGISVESFSDFDPVIAKLKMIQPGLNFRPVRTYPVKGSQIYIDFFGRGFSWTDRSVINETLRKSEVLIRESEKRLGKVRDEPAWLIDSKNQRLNQLFQLREPDDLIADVMDVDEEVAESKVQFSYELKWKPGQEEVWVLIHAEEAQTRSEARTAGRQEKLARFYYSMHQSFNADEQEKLKKKIEDALNSREIEIQEFKNRIEGLQKMTYAEVLAQRNSSFIIVGGIIATVLALMGFQALFSIAGIVVLFVTIVTGSMIYSFSRNYFQGLIYVPDHPARPTSFETWSSNVIEKISGSVPLSAVVGDFELESLDKNPAVREVNFKAPVYWKNTLSVINFKGNGPHFVRLKGLDAYENAAGPTAELLSVLGGFSSELIAHVYRTLPKGYVLELLPGLFVQPHVAGEPGVLEFVLLEALKNAVLHGNRLDLSKPIYVGWQIDAGNSRLRLQVIDTANQSKVKIESVSRARLKSIGLGGYGLGRAAIAKWLGKSFNYRWWNPSTWAPKRVKGADGNVLGHIEEMRMDLVPYRRSEVRNIEKFSEDFRISRKSLEAGMAGLLEAYTKSHEMEDDYGVFDDRPKLEDEIVAFNAVKNIPEVRDDNGLGKVAAFMLLNPDVFEAKLPESHHRPFRSFLQENLDRLVQRDAGLKTNLSTLMSFPVSSRYQWEKEIQEKNEAVDRIKNKTEPLVESDFDEVLKIILDAQGEAAEEAVSLLPRFYEQMPGRFNGIFFRNVLLFYLKGERSQSRFLALSVLRFIYQKAKNVPSLRELFNAENLKYFQENDRFIPFVDSPDHESEIIGFFIDLNPQIFNEAQKKELLNQYFLRKGFAGSFEEKVLFGLPEIKRLIARYELEPLRYLFAMTGAPLWISMPSAASAQLSGILETIQKTSADEALEKLWPLYQKILLTELFAHEMGLRPIGGKIYFTGDDQVVSWGASDLNVRANDHENSLVLPVAFSNKTLSSTIRALIDQGLVQLDSEQLYYVSLAFEGKTDDRVKIPIFGEIAARPFTTDWSKFDLRLGALSSRVGPVTHGGGNIYSTRNKELGVYDRTDLTTVFLSEKQDIPGMTESMRNMQILMTAFEAQMRRSRGEALDEVSLELAHQADQYEKGLKKIILRNKPILFFWWIVTPWFFSGQSLLGKIFSLIFKLLNSIRFIGHYGLREEGFRWAIIGLLNRLEKAKADGEKLAPWAREEVARFHGQQVTKIEDYLVAKAIEKMIVKRNPPYVVGQMLGLYLSGLSLSDDMRFEGIKAIFEDIVSHLDPLFDQRQSGLFVRGVLKMLPLELTKDLEAYSINPNEWAHKIFTGNGKARSELRTLTPPLRRHPSIPWPSQQEILFHDEIALEVQADPPGATAATARGTYIRLLNGKGSRDLYFIYNHPTDSPITRVNPDGTRTPLDYTQPLSSTFQEHQTALSLFDFLMTFWNQNPARDWLNARIQAGFTTSPRHYRIATDYTKDFVYLQINDGGFFRIPRQDPHNVHTLIGPTPSKPKQAIQWAETISAVGASGPLQGNALVNAMLVGQQVRRMLVLNLQDLGFQIPFDENTLPSALQNLPTARSEMRMGGDKEAEVKTRNEAVYKSISEDGILSGEEIEKRGKKFVGSVDGAGTGKTRQWISVNVIPYFAWKNRDVAAVIHHSLFDPANGILQVLLERLYDQEIALLKKTDGELAEILSGRSGYGIITVLNGDALDEVDQETLASTVRTVDAVVRGDITKAAETFFVKPIPPAAISHLFVPDFLVPEVSQYFPAEKIIPVQRKIQSIAIARRGERVFLEEKKVSAPLYDFESAMLEYVASNPEKTLVLHGIRLFSKEDASRSEARSTAVLDGKDQPKAPMTDLEWAGQNLSALANAVQPYAAPASASFMEPHVFFQNLNDEVRGAYRMRAQLETELAGQGLREADPGHPVYRDIITRVYIWRYLAENTDAKDDLKLETVWKAMDEENILEYLLRRESGVPQDQVLPKSVILAEIVNHLWIGMKVYMEAKMKGDEALQETVESDVVDWQLNFGFEVLDELEKKFGWFKELLQEISGTEFLVHIASEFGRRVYEIAPRNPQRAVTSLKSQLEKIAPLKSVEQMDDEEFRVTWRKIESELKLKLFKANDGTDSQLESAPVRSEMRMRNVTRDQLISILIEQKILSKKEANAITLWTRGNEFDLPTYLTAKKKMIMNIDGKGYYLDYREKEILRGNFEYEPLALQKDNEVRSVLGLPDYVSSGKGLKNGYNGRRNRVTRRTTIIAPRSESRTLPNIYGVVETGFDAIAEEYAKKYGVKVSPEIETRMKQFVASLPGTGLVLDAGTGPGRSAALFKAWFNEAQDTRDVYGIDLSQKMIDEARVLHPEISFERMNFNQLSFADGSVGGIWADASFHHVPSTDAGIVLQEFRRALNPKDGILFMTVKAGTTEGEEADPRYPGVNRFFKRYQLDELKALVEKNGYTVLDSQAQVSSITGDGWIHLLAQVNSAPKSEVRVDAVAEGLAKFFALPEALGMEVRSEARDLQKGLTLKTFTIEEFESQLRSAIEAMLDEADAAIQPENITGDLTDRATAQAVIDKLIRNFVDAVDQLGIKDDLAIAFLQNQKDESFADAFRLMKGQMGFALLTKNMIRALGPELVQTPHAKINDNGTFRRTDLGVVANPDAVAMVGNSETQSDVLPEGTFSVRGQETEKFKNDPHFRTVAYTGNILAGLYTAALLKKADELKNEMKRDYISGMLLKNIFDNREGVVRINEDGTIDFNYTALESLVNEFKATSAVQAAA